MAWATHWIRLTIAYKMSRHVAGIDFITEQVKKKKGIKQTNKHYFSELVCGMLKIN